MAATYDFGDEIGRKIEAMKKEESKMKWQERARQLAEEHWGYHETIPLYLHNSPNGHLFGNWYQSIFQHGYKHAIEDVKEGVVEVEK